MSLRITDSAAEKVCNLMDNKNMNSPDRGLRVGVQGGGCSGFTYIMDFDDSPNDGDIIIDGAHDVRMFVDNKSLIYMDGTVLDYVDELHGAGFKFRNPQAESLCGCGESFAM